MFYIVSSTYNSEPNLIELKTKRGYQYWSLKKIENHAQISFSQKVMGLNHVVANRVSYFSMEVV